MGRVYRSQFPNSGGKAAHPKSISSHRPFLAPSSNASRVDPWRSALHPPAGLSTPHPQCGVGHGHAPPAPPIPSSTATPISAFYQPFSLLPQGEHGAKFKEDGVGLHKKGLITHFANRGSSPRLSVFPSSARRRDAQTGRAHSRSLLPLFPGQATSLRGPQRLPKPVAPRPEILGTRCHAGISTTAFPNQWGRETSGG